LKLLILVALVAMVGALAVLVLTRILRPAQGSVQWPFYAKKVLSPPEQILYHRLVRALPECLVLAQVQLSRVLGVKKGSNFGEWNNRINRLSLDFVVCLKDSTVVAAIELDDSSHKEARRAEADARKARALEAAGIKLLRWSTNSIPNEAAIRLAFTSPQASDSAEAKGPNQGPTAVTA
jgi:hypothetical protein